MAGPLYCIRQQSLQERAHYQQKKSYKEEDKLYKKVLIVNKKSHIRKRANYHLSWEIAHDTMFQFYLRFYLFCRNLL